jgi:hypothetical protein
MSQYLNRVPISKADYSLCYYCDRPTKKRRDRPITADARTRDHILTKSHGRHDSRLFAHRGMFFGFRNCCADCNTLRTQVDHCVGVMMMLITEGKKCGISSREAGISLKIFKNKMKALKEA